MNDPEEYACDVYSSYLASGSAGPDVMVNLLTGDHVVNGMDEERQSAVPQTRSTRDCVGDSCVPPIKKNCAIWQLDGTTDAFPDISDAEWNQMSVAEHFYALSL